MGKKKNKTMHNFLQEGQRLGFVGSDLNEYANICHTAYLAKNTNKAAEPNSSHRQSIYKNPYMGNSVAAASSGLKQHNIKDKNSVLPKCPYCGFEHRTKQLCDKSPRYESHLLNIINKVPVNKPKPPALTLCWFCRALGHKKQDCVGVKMKKEKQYGIPSEANTCMNLKTFEPNKPPQLNCSLCEWRRHLGHETLPHVTLIGNTKVQCPGTMKEDNRIVVNNKDTSTSNSATESHDTVPTTTTSKGKSNSKTKTISPSKSTTPTSVKENPNSPKTVRTFIPQTNATTPTSVTPIEVNKSSTNPAQSNKTESKLKASGKNSSFKNSTDAGSNIVNAATKQRKYEWETIPISEIKNRIIEPVSEHAWWLKDGAQIDKTEMDVAFDRKGIPARVVVDNGAYLIQRKQRSLLTMVSPYMVEEKDYTGEQVYYSTDTGVQTAKLAYINLKSPYINGRLKVMVLEYPSNTRYGVLGNTYDLSEPTEEELEYWEKNYVKCFD